MHSFRHSLKQDFYRALIRHWCHVRSWGNSDVLVWVSPETRGFVYKSSTSPKVLEKCLRVSGLWWKSAQGKEDVNPGKEGRWSRVDYSGASPVAQWLRWPAFNSGDVGSVPGWGTEISHTVCCSQKKKKKKRVDYSGGKMELNPTWAIQGTSIGHVPRVTLPKRWGSWGCKCQLPPFIGWGCTWLITQYWALCMGRHRLQYQSKLWDRCLNQ